jgi:predicted O-linked N-acetylglucosamine transferase (SPINDLY family)
MGAIGLQSFVATSEDDFVNAAQRLAEPANLSAIRSGLRDAMKPLLDGANVARRMEELCLSRAASVRTSAQKVEAACCG